MSRVSECLNQIMSARYGKDVRQSIHDSIKELNEVAVTAQGSATVNAQTAITKANEALTASKAAIESAKQAKAYADNAQAVAGVTVATQDTAGLVKGGENHISLDGTLELVVKTTEASMPNSRKGRVEVVEIGGVCVKDNMPSPDIPQEIKNSVVSGVKTHGKQHINPNNTFNGSPTIKDDGYTISHTGKNAWEQRGFIVRNIEAGQVWYASAESITNTIANQGTIAFQQRDANGGIVTTAYMRESVLSVNFTIAENTVEFTVLVLANGTGTVLESDSTITVKGLMLSLVEGSKWEPYKGTTITLSNPIDLYGIGDVQDVITPKQIKRRFAEVVFDGSDDERWYFDSTSESGKKRLATLFIQNSVRKTEVRQVANILSNMFVGVSANATYGTHEGISIDNGGRLHAYHDEYNNSLADWKAHLQSNPMKVIYELDEEVIEELPIADQIALNSLATYDGITYIEFDSEVQPTFKGKYGTSLVGGIALEAYNQAHTHSRTVLWTNSDKTQPLAAGTVLFPFSLDAYEQYEFYLVTYCDSTATEHSAKQVLMARAAGTGNGNNVRLEAVIKEGDTYHQHERSLAYSYDSNAFVVAQCTYLDASFKAQTANDKLIPYQIIGIR